MTENQPLRRALQLISGAIVLFFLYFGREILIPVTLSVILSFLLAPAVRRLRHVGIGATVSVLLTVTVFTAAISVAGMVLGGQVIKLASSLPQYETTIRDKLRTINQITLEKLHSVTGKADLVIQGLPRKDDDAEDKSTASRLPAQVNGKPIPVEVHQPAPTPLELVSKILGSITGPIETTGLVFVMLVFVLLEHESLRDRFIRLIGNDNLRATTIAVNDAGTRLSRFFISQFAVNGACGLAIGLALAIAGVPQAVLWGVMTALLRFIPYIGAWMAAGLATLLAFAISPGWELAITTLVIFVVIELIVSQVVEPQLYGHTTGLSPLSVVLAAVFWNWLWGPVGLVLSTPLTLCLVVAGRYIPSLKFLEILLGEVTALTLPEKFYQRALAGDSDELIEGAQRFIRRKSVAEYCDAVLVPALNLAQIDFAERAITDDERVKVGGAIASVLISLEGCKPAWIRKRRSSVLDGETLARHLIHQREALHGEYQGPIDVPAGSVVLVVGVGAQGDELAAEILVRVLRADHVDARHVLTDDLLNPPVDVPSDLVAAICFVAADNEQKAQELFALADVMREKLPEVCLLALLVQNVFDQRHRAQERKIPYVQQFRSYQEIATSVRIGMKIAEGQHHHQN